MSQFYSIVQRFRWSVLTGGSGVALAGLAYQNLSEAEKLQDTVSPSLDGELKPDYNARLLFLGSGSSTGVPRPSCLLPQNCQKDSCRVSRLALQEGIPPEKNRNYRGNPSLMIHTPAGSFVQIDAGKTFRENMVRWYPRLGVTSLDALILTHEHADALLGLDDLRGLQGKPSKGQSKSTALKVFLDHKTMESIKSVFPYLLPNSQDGKAVTRWVASLDFSIVEKFKPFVAAGLEVTPLPVMHGEDYESLGFSFGKEQRVVYLSDVSRIPSETDSVLRKGPIDILILDALFFVNQHPTHFSLHEALEVVRDIKPRRTILIGLSDDIEYHEVTEYLRTMKDINVDLAYDGLSIDVKL